MRTNRWMVAMVGTIAVWGSSDVSGENERTLVVEDVILAPIQEVWDSFYTEKGREWMTPVNSIELRIGGLIRSSYVPDADLDGDDAIHQEIIAMEIGRRMVARQVRSPLNFPHREGLLGIVGILEFDPIGPEATRVRSIMTGFPETPAGEAVLAFFRQGNASTFDSAKKHLERPDQTQRTDRALELLGSLVGGEWIHESETPDGMSFRVRNVVRNGPDGKSLVSNGWLGFGDGAMFDHGPTLVWLDPTGVIEFKGVHETGATGSGVIRLIEDNTIEWDWIETTPNGERHHYAIGMTIPGGDRYTAAIEIVGDDGVRTKFAGPVEYRRVDVAPERFLSTIATEKVKMDLGKRIEVTEIIPASVEDVWESWTTSAGMTAFLGAEAEIELRRGGKFEIYFDENAEAGSRGSETCEILSYVSGKMLSFTWNAPPQFTNVRFIHTWVVVEFEAISDGATEFTITHHGWDENMASHPQYADEWTGTFEYFEAAWPRVMGALRAYHEKR